MAEAFLFSLLLEAGHDQRDVLERPGPSAEPAHPKRVEEYIRAHLSEPVSLATLATVGGVGARALQLGFRAHRYPLLEGATFRG